DALGTSNAATNVGSTATGGSNIPAAGQARPRASTSALRSEFSTDSGLNDHSNSNNGHSTEFRSPYGGGILTHRSSTDNPAGVSGAAANPPPKLTGQGLNENLFIKNYLRRGTPSSELSHETALSSSSTTSSTGLQNDSAIKSNSSGLLSPTASTASLATVSSTTTTSTSTTSGGHDFTPQLRKVTNPLGMHALPTRNGLHSGNSSSSSSGSGMASASSAKLNGQHNPGSTHLPSPRTAGSHYGNGHGASGGASGLKSPLMVPPKPPNLAGLSLSSTTPPGPSGIPASPSASPGGSQAKNSSRVTFAFTSPHTTHRQIIDPVIRQLQLRTPHLPARNALKALAEAFHRAELEVPGIADKLLQAWMDKAMSSTNSPLSPTGANMSGGGGLGGHPLPALPSDRQPMARK
ncbi:hypothetical protein H4R33_006082, partial [Dimargaris cristalligena]